MSETTRTGWAHIVGWCSCGATFNGRSDPPDHVEDAYGDWRFLHDLRGHHAVAQSEARNVRRRERRRVLGEVV